MKTLMFTLNLLKVSIIMTIVVWGFLALIPLGVMIGWNSAGFLGHIDYIDSAIGCAIFFLIVL